MPKVELKPLAAEAQALAARIGELLKDSKVGETVTLPPDLAQAISDSVREAIAPAILARRRLEWLHSRDSCNVDGYEWGIFRVKWENGRAVEVWQTNADFSDLDAAAGVTAAPASQQFMVSSIKHKAGIVTLVTINAEDVRPPLEPGLMVTLATDGVKGRWKPCARCTTHDYCTNSLRGCDIAESLEAGIAPLAPGYCDPATGKPYGAALGDPADKLRRCSLGCLDYGQCKANMHGRPSDCPSGVSVPDHRTPSSKSSEADK